MDIKIKNIGMICNANINIDGLTVITGENNSGKSTVGKLIYSIYSSLNNSERDFVTNRTISIQEDVSTILRFLRNANADIKTMNSLIEVTLSSNNFSEDNKKVMTKLIEKIESNIYKKYDLNKETKKYFNNIKEKVNLNKTDNTIQKLAIERTLDSEFSKQINNIYNEEVGSVDIFEGIKRVIAFEVINNKIKDDSLIVEEISYNDVTYIDSPLILDDISIKNFGFDTIFRRYVSHSEDLLNKLSNNSAGNNIVHNMMLEKKYNKINQQISKVLNGTISRQNDKYTYKSNNKHIMVSNLATGLKSYAIIKLLLDSSILNSNSLLIIDEPEIHLHPEWQVVFAELIVLLTVEIGINVVLTSHSPYFIEAIEVFSKKYKFDKRTRFYLAKKFDGKCSTINEITGDLTKTYEMLLNPFQELENIAEEIDGYDC